MALELLEQNGEEEQEPLFRDLLFHQKGKHHRWLDCRPPVFSAPVADTHTHLHLLPDPALALARSCALGVSFISTVTDPAEEGTLVFDRLDRWIMSSIDALEEIAISGDYTFPHVRITVGVHPHNARLYTPEIENLLLELIKDPRVNAIGEIGLDYHYDFSPREVQRRVFERQLELAHHFGLPVALHLREAHEDAMEILRRVGFPSAGTILHCCSLPEEELAPWIETGCYIAYGGALTFSRSEEARVAAGHVPQNRLLTETDAPYMAPHPLRGSTAEPAHVLLTAQCLAGLFGATEADLQAVFLRRLYNNAHEILDKPSLGFQTRPWLGVSWEDE